MIEVYKILHGVYDERVTSELFNIMDQARTRGYSLRLTKHRCGLDMRKNFFTSRVVNVWNSLTEKIVFAPSVNAFENGIDKLWYNHQMKFNPDIEYSPNQHMTTHDPGSQRTAEIQMTDDELNIEAAGLRSEST